VTLAVLAACALTLQVFYYSTLLFISSGLTEESAKFATIGIGAIMVGMTLVSIPLMDRTGRRTLHLYGLGGMFIFSIFITISFLIKVRKKDLGSYVCSSVVPHTLILYSCRILLFISIRMNRLYSVLK
jgi:MFS family permease